MPSDNVAKYTVSHMAKFYMYVKKVKFHHRREREGPEG
jgi:hypothetical protein